MSNLTRISKVLHSSPQCLKITLKVSFSKLSKWSNLTTSSRPYSKANMNAVNPSLFFFTQMILKVLKNETFGKDFDPI